MFAPVEMTTIYEKNKNFTITMNIDTFSKRIWVKALSFNNPEPIAQFLINTCREHGLEKIIIPTPQEHIQSLTRHGFKSEGLIKGYLNGRKAYFLTAYANPARAKSPSRPKYLSNICKITKSPAKAPEPLQPGYRITQPTLEDVKEMAGVFKKVFKTYPSPVDQPGYLASVLDKSALFRTVKHQGAVISIAAAEIDRHNRCAEMTNCATLPEARGLGLMSRILMQLEKDCLEKEISCLYSLARASSYGMNLVFHRLGYTFGGTLINNCHISGNYEDMNIWFKTP